MTLFPKVSLLRCSLLPMKIWIVFPFLLSTLFGAAQSGETVFFVSPDGKANNPGTKERPFATAQQARDAVRKMKAKMPAQRYSVYFREGVYFLKEPFELSAADSGALGNPLIFAGYEGENVVFHGGARLDPADFKPVTDKTVLERLLPEARGKVLEINLKKAGIADFGVMRHHGFGIVAEPAPLELFMNGERQTLARYPNEGKLGIGKMYDSGSVPRHGDFSGCGAEFGYEYERPARWIQADDIWLHGKFSFGYNDDNLRVEKIDTARKSLKMERPHLYGIRSSIYVDTSKWIERAGLSSRGYYAYNLLEEIDRPGEWYLDRTTGKLYICPPVDFAAAEVDVSLLEAPFIRLVNTAHVVIENIRFSTARGMGIYLENARHISITGCTFDNLGTVAISAGQPLQNAAQRYALDGSPVLDQWVSEDFHHISIRNCRISRTGSGGIILTGGNRRTLTPSGNEIAHCDISTVDQINNTYSPAVKLAGVGNTVRNCHIYDMKHMAIGFSGNDHLISNNLFERLCTDADDMGAICVGRDPSARGTVIRHNHFRDIVPFDRFSQVGAIFLDDGTGGIEVAHNLFERVGSQGDEGIFGCIAIHAGYDNHIHHNVFLDCETAIGNQYWAHERWKTFLESPLLQERLLKTVDITSPLYLERYPELKNYFTDFSARSNRIAHNILINSQLVLHGFCDFFRNEMAPASGKEQALKKIGFEKSQIGPEN